MRKKKENGIRGDSTALRHCQQKSKKNEPQGREAANDSENDKLFMRERERERERERVCV